MLTYAMEGISDNEKIKASFEIGTEGASNTLENLLGATDTMAIGVDDEGHSKEEGAQLNGYLELPGAHNLS